MVKHSLLSPRLERLVPIAFLMAGGLVVIAAMGCGRTAVNPNTAEDSTGSVQLALQAAPGLTFAAATYTLSGPESFTRSGAVDIANSSTLSFVVGAIPAGIGYTITVNATSTDGSTSCAGTSAGFGIVAGQVAVVPLGLSCHQASQTGSAMISGTINVCPVIDGVSASPAEVLVGGTIDLSAVAHDPDQGPAPLTYAWTATAGVFSDTSAAHSSFACTVPGPVTLTLSVTDGDPQPGCAGTSTVTIICSPAGATGGAGGTSGAGGAGGECGSDPCTIGEKRCADGLAIQVCAIDPNGCTTWKNVSCPTGEVCERHAPASCADPSWAAWPLPGDREWNFTDNMDSTFTDNITGLTWQNRGQGYLTQDEAVSYCQNLTDGNHHDWRLPTMIELLSITAVLTDGESVPFLTMFGGARSATPVAGRPSWFWGVVFIGGMPSQSASGFANAEYWTHCVR